MCLCVCLCVFVCVWALFMCNELVFLHHGVLSNAKHFPFVTVMQTSSPAVSILFCMFIILNDVDAGQQHNMHFKLCGVY